MIFQLRTKAAPPEGTIGADTLKRWRDASARYLAETDLPDIVEDVRFVEEVKVESMTSVEWPDAPPALGGAEHVAGPSALAPASPAPAAPGTPGPKPVASISERPSAAEAVERSRDFARRGIARLAQPFLQGGGFLQQQQPVPTANPFAKPQDLSFVQPVKSLTADTNLPLEEDLRRRFGTNVRSALGPGTIIEGTFSFDSPVCIDGTLIGEVHSTSVLIVGNQANVNARVKVGSLVVLGSVTGKVDARDLVEIRSGGSLEGDIQSERLVIEDGGWFYGKCTPTSPSRSKKESPN